MLVCCVRARRPRTGTLARSRANPHTPPSLHASALVAAARFRHKQANRALANRRVCTCRRLGWQRVFTNSAREPPSLYGQRFVRCFVRGALCVVRRASRVVLHVCIRRALRFALRALCFVLCVLYVARCALRFLVRALCFVFFVSCVGLCVLCLVLSALCGVLCAMLVAGCVRRVAPSALRFVLRAL